MMTKGKKKKSPFSVTIVRWGVIIFGIVNIWQAWAIAQQANLQLVYSGPFTPTIRSLLAIGWAVVAFGLAAALWQRRPWTRIAIPVAGALFLIYHLGLLSFSLSSIAQQGWSGNLVIGLILLTFVTWSLNRPEARAYLMPAMAEEPFPGDG